MRQRRRRVPTSRADASAHGTNEAGGRVGWFELFFDLVIAAAIVYGSHLYAQDPTWSQGAWMAVTLAVLVFVWLLTSLHHNLAPGDRLWRWLIVLVEMLAMVVAVLSEGRQSGLPDRVGFAALAVTFGCLALLYGTAGGSRDVPASIRGIVWGSLAIGALILAGGALIPENGPAGDVLAPIVLAAGLLAAAVPILTVALQRVVEQAPLRSEHLSERTGQLVMIVLGESFVSLILRVGAESAIPRPLFLALTFIAVFAIWILYFRTVLPRGVPSTPGRLRVWLAATWLLLYGGIGAAGTLATLTVTPIGTDPPGHVTPLPLLYVLVALAILTALSPTSNVLVRAPGWRTQALTCLVLAALVVGGFLLPDDQAWWMTVGAVIVICVDAALCLRRSTTP